MPSFNFDTTAMLNMAAQIFNGFGGLFWIIAGISVGFGLLVKVFNIVRGVFGTG